MKISLPLCKHPVWGGVQLFWQLTWEEWKPLGILIVATFLVPYFIFRFFSVFKFQPRNIYGESNHPATDFINSQCTSTCSALAMAISPNTALDFPKSFRVTLCCKFNNSENIANARLVRTSDLILQKGGLSAIHRRTILGKRHRSFFLDYLPPTHRPPFIMKFMPVQRVK